MFRVWRRLGALRRFSSQVDNQNLRVFNKNSVILHQFDNETRNLMAWEKPKSASSVQWNKLPQTYTNDELIEAFADLINYSVSHNINLSDPMYDYFVDEFTESLFEFTTNEIIRAIQIFARAPLEKILIVQRNYIELYKAFDQALTIKSVNMLPEQVLFLSSIWKCMPSAQKTHLSLLLTRLLNRYFRNMNAAQLSQAMHFINLLNKPIEDIPALENIIETRMDEMSLQELATVVWTFNRIETKIQKAALKTKIYEHLEKQDLSQLEYKFLVQILNTIAQLPAESDEQLTQLRAIMKNLSQGMIARPLRDCLLIANVGSSSRVFDEKLMTLFFQRCLNQSEEIVHFSLYELELLSRLINIYPVNSNIRTEIGRQILDQLRNRVEFAANQGFHRHLIKITRNLIVRDIYDVELLDNIFRPDYIRFIYKTRKQLDGAMYEIDGYTRINLKDIYHGNRLSDIYLGKFKHLGIFVPDQESRYKRSEAYTYQIENVIKKLFKYHQYAHAVSHHRNADNFVCIDKRTMESVDVSQNYPPLYTGKSFEASQLTENDPNLLVFAFVSGNINGINITTDEQSECEDVSFSYLELKVQQLQLLGFQPILVPVVSENLETYIVSLIHQKLKQLGIKNEIRQSL